MAQQSQSAFPSHGRISCTICFPKPAETLSEGVWRFRNDPGHWGSSNPKILVLGFSKGATQVRAYECGLFEDVPFAGARERLKKVLLALGVLSDKENLNLKFRREEKDFAFASLIRCSVARYDSRNQNYICSGPVVLKAFQEPEPRRLLTSCGGRFLQTLPNRLRLVIMLGVQDKYISECRKLMAWLYPGQIVNVNAVAYANCQTTWVHATHPSPANGWFNEWVSGIAPVSTLGKKRELAKEAVAKCQV